MANPFLAEIRIFPFNFPPKGWAFCDGQLMSISQNTALFSLLGTTYGGDGRSNFALPNLQGSVPLHVGGGGQGPGLSIYDLGETGGVETVALLQSEMPVHSHFLDAQAIAATTASPANAVFATPGYVSGSSRGVAQVYTTAAPNTQLLGAMSVAGASLPHNNLMPYLTLNFCIALQGVFPPRS
ncbi:MAG: phage tail protein [Methylobacteriaceae bacterium]|nr:phage tail protein [Methylobacteriaceae bacterium]